MVSGGFEALGRRHELVLGGNWYDRSARSYNAYALPGRRAASTCSTTTCVIIPSRPTRNGAARTM